MRFQTALILLLGAAGAASAQDAAIDYPETRTVGQTDEFFGETVEDPYRWLETDVRESEEVADWIAAQNAVTETYLSEITGREAIAQRMAELWDFETQYLPRTADGRLFVLRRSAGQNQPVLYVQDGLDGEARELIDPNAWSEDGTLALADYWPSPDGSMVLYTMQDGGSDWRTAHVLDVSTGEVLADTVEWIKFSELAWAPDVSGFFYARYPAPDEGAAFQNLNYDHEVYFHAIGTPQADDASIYKPEDREVSVSPEVSDDGRWLVVTAAKGTDDAYEIVLKDLEYPEAAPWKLVEGFDHDYRLIGSAWNRLYFITSRAAPMRRIVAVDPLTDAREWVEIVPERESVLAGAHLIGEAIVANYQKDAQSLLTGFDLNGGPKGDLALPRPGAVSGLRGHSGQPDGFFSFASFVQPETIYHLDADTGAMEVFAAPEPPFDPDAFTVEQRFYESDDGTRIPIFIAKRADLPEGEPRPALLYGYGGFNISYVPDFFPQFLTWMDMGGVFAVANIRGGGEYGDAWHDAGRLANKQNVFDDFAAAGRFLIDEGLTTSDQLGIHGRSNGGLLVGAVVNQNPDLMAVGLPTVGVMDMLRFNQFTAGRFWTDDYGDPGIEPDYRVLRAYSPYHNIDPEADYPAILATTGDTDDRVVPGHTFKYIAALQAAQGGDVAPGDEPVLVRVETRAGHGAGKPKEKRIAEYADQLAFLAHHTGMEILPAPPMRTEDADRRVTHPAGWSEIGEDGETR